MYGILRLRHVNRAILLLEAYCGGEREGYGEICPPTWTYLTHLHTYVRASIEGV